MAGPHRGPAVAGTGHVADVGSDRHGHAVEFIWCRTGWLRRSSKRWRCWACSRRTRPTSPDSRFRSCRRLVGSARCSAAKPPGAMTPLRMSLTASASAGSSPVALRAGRRDHFPVAVADLQDGCGVAVHAAAGKVAYASAISSGLTSTMPRVNEGTIVGQPGPRPSPRQLDSHLLGELPRAAESGDPLQLRVERVNRLWVPV